MKSPTEIWLFLLLDLAIIIVAARSLGALARRAGQPGVIGEIVAGIVLGPTVLGRIHAQWPAALFPPDVPVRQFADLGLVLFIFVLGMELDPDLIRKEGRRALSISISGIVFPFVLGALVAIPLLPLNNNGTFVDAARPHPIPLAFSLFMGAAMCITAFPVLARILVDRGLYKSPMGALTLCSAAVDDVAAWILLAAVVAVSRTGSPKQVAMTLALTGLFALGMVILVRPAMARLADRCEARGHLTVDHTAVVVVCLLLSAYATERIGIHSIFGAFMFGVVMPHGSRMTRELTDKIEDLTVVVLLPAFFAVAGLRTNLFALGSPKLLLWTLLVISVAIVGKLGGCSAAARLNGYSGRDAFTLGILMNTRGLTELVILTVGFTLGVLSDAVFAMMVLMALVTTFMASAVMNVMMPRREMVRILAGGDPQPTASRVLVALGNPQNARALVGAGIALTGRRRPAELLLVRLIPTPRAPEFRAGLREEEMQVRRSIDALDKLRRQVIDAGISARAISFLSDDVGQDLAYVAATQACDRVLLGWHRASLERRVIRALVHRLFKLAACDVVVFVDRRGDGLQRAGGPVLLFADSRDTESLMPIGQAVAESLETNVGPVGVSAVDAGAVPALVSDGATAVASIAPGTALHDPSAATAAVVMVGPAFSAEDDFGHPATGIVESAEFPVLVVRPQSMVGGREEPRAA